MCSRKCTIRLIEIDGPDSFRNGCPVCNHKCCCSSKALTCNRAFHCYRKCPVSKQTMLEKDKVVEPLDIDAIYEAQLRAKEEERYNYTSGFLLSKGKRIAPLKRKRTEIAKPRSVEEEDHELASSVLLSMKNNAATSMADDVSSSLGSPCRMTDVLMLAQLFTAQPSDASEGLYSGPVPIRGADPSPFDIGLSAIPLETARIYSPFLSDGEEVAWNDWRGHRRLT